MTAQSSHAVIPLAIVAGAMVLTAAACGTDAASTPSPTSAGEPTVTVTATEPAPAPTSPTSAPSSTPGGAGGGSGCAVGSLKITYANDTGGGGAGSVAGALTFRNTGSAACTLSGFPGVSFVGGGNGTQVGQAATRTDAAVKTRTLEPGTSVKAALRRTQPGNYGDDCGQTKVDGFRVFPPGSTESAFVAFPTTGCKSADVPLLQVGPVS
ncbi:DUF4232 domain-containing protein [Microlunatus antarcticus]|uniref:DUF4232 domain-containing protein n=1 Tax=Microlunatus antarcticus TaxID=53388 RepID=A0A7W5P6I2_9ACTN|nr:DUF4232 domain-containing protein [Microlunatus antarcticus]MBB3326525.1 hypothetical protein [Microlunatus antarcticus]